MWKSLMIPDAILMAIEELSFDEPTPIQQQVLPIAIRDYADILGSAPTGSGKTLAFGIPLLTRVHERKIRLTDQEISITENQSCPSQLVEKNKKRLRKDEEKPTKSPGLDQKMTRSERKRRKIFDKLSLIEELDPDTMKVVHVHNLSNQEENAVPTSNIPANSQLESKNALSVGVLGLVILPTRELAIQVTGHLRALAKHLKSPGVSIEAVVGGISIQKQDRILRQQKPDVIVATPGRLWEFIQQEHEHLVSMPQTLCVVVYDEADRLVESQHFVELGSILRFLKKPAEGGRRQTLVFSATLAFVHSNALIPGAHAKKGAKKLGKQTMDTAEKLGYLRDMFGLSARAKVVDLSSSTPQQPPTAIGKSDPSQQTEKRRVGGVGMNLPEGLSEYRLPCSSQPEKDTLLVWCLLTQISKCRRSLVFLNSKSGARRLAGVLRQCPEILPHLSVLHADLIQKQRLRSLERFQGDQGGVILATDVAARGLDFAASEISLVVHFDVPHTAEVYIHRCGRTARASRCGTSVVLLEPADIVRWRKLTHNLGHLSLVGGLPDLPEMRPGPDTAELRQLQSVVRLMRQLDELEHSHAKKTANRDWFRRTALEADLVLDSDLDVSSDDEGSCRTLREKKNKQSTDSLRREISMVTLAWKQLNEKKVRRCVSPQEIQIEHV